MSEGTGSGSDAVNPDSAMVAEIRARADAATAGPWVHYYPGQDCVGHCVDPVAHDMTGLVETHANAEFIAHARVDVPWLLDRIETLTIQLANMTEQWEEEAGRAAEYYTAAALAEE